MKMYFSLIVAGSVLSAIQTNAQAIQPAFQVDVGISTTVTSPPRNTGIDIAPHNKNGGALTYTAVAYDDPTASFYEIKWFDPSGSLISTLGGNGGDPDVSYYSNPDLTAVAYCDWSSPASVWLDVYKLMSYPGPPPTMGYSIGNITYVGDGVYPNIDINSLGDGVFCYEDGGQIMLCTFTPGSVNTVFGPTVSAGTGVQPDVIVTDDNDLVVVTFVNGADLNVVVLDHTDLQSGTLTVLGTFNYTSSGSGHAFPRIASAKNAGLLSPQDFTVVAEDQTSSGTLIRAYSFMGASPTTQYVVNSGLTSCTNSKPVVTYTFDKIVFSWSADYSACTFTVAPPNSTHTDVLLREYDGMSFSPLNGGDHFEVNQSQGSFYQSNVAIGTQKDGNYISFGLEAMVYSNNSDIFRKNRTSTGFYEPAKEENNDVESALYGQGRVSFDQTVEAPTMTSSLNTYGQLRLIGNPINKTIILQSSDVEATNVTLISASGQVVNLDGRVHRKGNRLTILVGDLATGIYFLYGEVNDYKKVIRVNRI